jgi:hypothetical protein
VAVVVAQVAARALIPEATIDSEATVVAEVRAVSVVQVDQEEARVAARLEFSSRVLVLHQS